MAGAVVTTTSLDELLKRVYPPEEIMQMVNLTHPVLEKCARKGTARLGGEGFFFAVRLESAEGHAWISEEQDLPDGGQSNVRQAQVNPTVHAGVVQLTGLSQAVSAGDSMAFARAFDEETQQTIQAMAASKEGALFRDGSGVLATFNGDPAATAGPHTLSDVGFLREGMCVDIIDTADDARHTTGIKIDAVDWVNRTVTFDSALPAIVGDADLIYITNSQLTTQTAPVAKEPLGLEAALLDTGTYLGIDRATGSNWRANVLDAANAPFDEDILIRMRTRITQESGVQLQTMASSFGAVMHPSKADDIFKLAIPRMRFSGSDVMDLGNKTEVQFGGMSFNTSYACPTRTVYVGDWQYNQSLYTPNGELHIDSEYNGSPLKWVPTKDQGLVFVKEYHQFVNKKPICFGRIINLADATR